jgi:mono/diheme cytochrome c family protein
MTVRPGLVAAAVGLALTGCGDSSKSADPLAERGRQVYMSQCTQCHATDPAQAGAVGPAVRNASKALLEAKVVRGEYPPGYSPKRPTKVMPPMPALAPDIDALTAYLR